MFQLARKRLSTAAWSFLQSTGGNHHLFEIFQVICHPVVMHPQLAFKRRVLRKFGDIMSN